MTGARETVWLALSELWLDTQPDAASLGHLAGVLRRSGFSRAELEQIFLYEVAPRVWLNHWSVAGVWDGFDAQWLYAGCRRNQQGGRWHRWKCRLLRRPMTYACAADWQQVLAQLEP
ncbi:hypothetical protein A9179_00185 [Pseudomonas alcaligenes]|uniref:DUF7079 domain-containing protein n=1 Tax=Aquipseudomonas alcaligenes TaxID=43263 RepID=A0ABR7RU93_AQUAC|nr:hypothetical protein [Pseudomonas alcaligenes]